MKYKMTLPSGLVLDFTNMFGTDRLQDEEVALSLETIGAAAAAAEAGDVVLMSPASAAFDQFKNFMVRGEFYKKLVKEL